MKPFDLSGKRILVTGASSGIGRACAIQAAGLGAAVVLTGRRREALDETWRRMENASLHTIIEGDIASSEFIDCLTEGAGRLDGLVHSAGVAVMSPIGMTVKAQVDSVMAVNYYAFLELMKYYAKAKYRNDGFSAVAVSSVSALAGWGGGTLYCGSKGALSSSVRALAMELAPKHIRVNAVCPSNIKTPLYDAGAVAVNDKKSLEGLLEKQPFGLGMPEQVAAPVCFLLSDAASFITGVNLPVDGGYLAH